MAACFPDGSLVRCDTDEEAQGLAPSNALDAGWQRDREALERRIREDRAREQGELDGMILWGSDRMR